ncbi:hypothetical protein VTO42DRAFT_2999 [Malbranchea cinnamomea]
MLDPRSTTTEYFCYVDITMLYAAKKVGQRPNGTGILDRIEPKSDDCEGIVQELSAWQHSKMRILGLSSLEGHHGLGISTTNSH